MIRQRKQAGFSLIELIVVIVLLGVLATGAGMLILRPIEAYDAQQRRQQLVDQGEMALRQIARDVRQALPNSLRVPTAGSFTNLAVEMVNTVDGARYRDEFGGIYVTDENFRLDFISADTSFNLLGGLNNPAAFDPANRIVIYNTSDSIYAEALELDNEGIITNSSTVIGFSTLNPGPNREDQITMTPGFRFTQQSPGQRLFFVNGAISYVCDLAGGRILRYSGYGFVNPQPTPTAPPLTGVAETVITQLSACSMTYTAGTTQRGGLLSLNIAIANAGEVINLFHQVHVNNVP